MRTAANNRTTPTATYCAHQYRAIKHNKCDTVFEMESIPALPTFLTMLVRVEDFQGYSKAQKFTLYFRLKNKTNWRESEAVTGLFRTSRHGVYFGNRRTENRRTLILFQFAPDGEGLTVYTYPEGYYPGPATIEAIAAHL